MEEELWGVWNKLRDIAKSNPTIANVWHKAENNALVKKALSNEAVQNGLHKAESAVDKYGSAAMDKAMGK